MSRTYRELATGRCAVLIEFQRALPGQRPARYVLAWADNGLTFIMTGPQVLREFEHIEESVKVKVST